MSDGDEMSKQAAREHADISTTEKVCNANEPTSSFCSDR